MSSASISLAQSPPLSVPARFFVTAPAFGILAAAVMAWTASAGLADRWAPAMLAVTHLLTLGYMGMVMLGALIQVFPVVIGHPLRQTPRVGATVHVSLTIGVVLLAAAFLTTLDGLMLAAILMLVAAVLTFSAAAIATLAAVRTWGDTARAIALALAAFLVMSGFGVWLALGHAGQLPLARQWTDMHAGWGLAGWVPLLLMGVAYQVVPMFQLTPNYPRILSMTLPALLFAMLVTATLAQWLALPAWLTGLSQAVAGLVLAGFAITTLALQRRRRRWRPDVTVNYWQLGLVCLALAVGVWLAGQWLTGLRADARYPLMLGVLMIPGFSLAVINGMLYKIVPFLVWLHLTMAPAGAAKPAAGRVPSMKQIVPDRRSRLQFRIHTLALLLIGAGVLGVPGMQAAGALVFAVACGCLGRDILAAIRLYQRTTQAAPAGT